MEPDTELALEIVADVLLNPAFPEDEVNREREAQIAAIKAEDDRLTTVAFKKLRKGIFGDRPYALARNGTEESVASLNIEQLREFQEKYIVGNNGIIAVFGDVKAGEIKNQIEEKFADLPAGEESFKELDQAPIELANTNIIEEERDKKPGRAHDWVPLIQHFL